MTKDKEGEGLGTYAELMPKELWTEVYPNLWIGGTDEDDIVGKPEIEPMITKEDFDTVVTMHAWSNPVGWYVREFRQHFHDDGVDEFDEQELKDLVDFVIYELHSGKRVLVRCLSGLNRSGLVTALVMMNLGYTADDAIAHLRKTRSTLVLCNKEFEAWLRQKERERENNTE